MIEYFGELILDSLKTLPILLGVYFLLEFIEYKGGNNYKNRRLFNGKIAPVFGSLVGCLPQCGVSVVATDLFSKGNISIGALVAVYISTSDEALPILLSNPTKIVSVIALIVTKIVFAIIVGYLAMFLYPIFFKKDNLKAKALTENSNNIDKSSQVTDMVIHETKTSDTLVLGEKSEDDSHEEDIIGCCHHHIENKKKYDWKHPLVHSLKIFAYILVINLIMGTIIYAVGEDNLIKFLGSSSALQPLLACVIGLIPNCASSVIITELYLLGGLSFGSIIAGLSVNAGLGMLMLLKQNKNVKQNAFIIILILTTSLALGYALHFIL